MAEAPAFNDLEALPAPLPAGDASKVRKWLLSWLWENTKFAKAQTETFRNAVIQAELDYRGAQYAPSVEQAKKQGTEIRFEEHKNQVNVSTAIMVKSQKRSGRTFRIEAINGEVQSKADALQALVDSMLEETGFERETCRFWLRFNKHDAACMKLFCEYRTALEPEQYSLLQDEAPTHIQALDALGVPFEVLSRDDDQVVFETQRLKGSMMIGGRCVDMRNLAFANPNRPDIQSQPSIHEFHIFTEDELEDNEMFAVDWALIGAPNANGKASTDNDKPAEATGDGAVSNNFRQWEVVESHGRIPWTRQIRKGTFSEGDLLAFVQEVHGPDATIADCMIAQKWIAWHLEDKALLKLDPTYCPDKNSYPYHMSSYVDGDLELVGQSQMRQTLPLSNAMNAFIQDGLDNVRVRGGINAFYDSNDMSIDPDKFAELRTGKNVLIPSDFPQGRSPKDSVLFVNEFIPSTFEDCMKGYGLCKSESRDFGVPDIMQANGDAGTATQDTINNERGQAKLDYPFGLAILDVIVPIVRDICLLVFKHFDGKRMIRIAGEEGAALGELKLVTRADITSRFRVIPMASLDFINRQQRANTLLQYMNIIGRVAQPKQLMANAAMFLEEMGFSRQQINLLTDNVGRGSTAEQEINVMCYQPAERMQDRVREDDDPYERMMLIRRIMGVPEMGIPPGDPEKAAMLEANPNFHEYVAKLEDLMALNEARDAGAIPAKPGQESPKGRNPQPNPNPPKSQEGVVRQAAQQESGPDNGGNTTGMTGRAMAGANA